MGPYEDMKKELKDKINKDLYGNTDIPKIEPKPISSIGVDNKMVLPKPIVIKPYSNVDFIEPEKKEIGYLENYLDHKLVEIKKFEESKKNIKETPHYWKDIKDDKLYEYVVEDSIDKENIKEKWPNDTLFDFLYSIDEYQDPTYLGFNLMIDKTESSMFNFDQGFDIGQASTALKFIQKYHNITEIAQRENILFTFLNQLTSIFQTLPASNNTNKKYYIQTITGLQKLNKPIIKYGDDILEITLNEDVSLRTQYLIELYKNLLYDFKNKREVIPENALRFNMYVKISDIRDFKVENPTYDPDNDNKREKFIKMIPNAGETALVYKLYDCNFVIDDSMITHEDTISIGGWETFNSGNMNNVKIKIKYKSVSRVLKSNLIDKQYLVELNTHNLSGLYRTGDVSFADMKHNNDYKYLSLVENGTKKPLKNKKKTIKKITEIQENPIDKFFNKKKDMVTKTLKKNIKTGKNELIAKFDEIRGQLITEIVSEVRDTTKLPKIYPENIYSTDFRKLSIKNFTMGLASSLQNDLLDENDIFSATDITKKLR